MAIPNSSATVAVMTAVLLLLAAGRVAEGQSSDCAVKLVPCEDYLNPTNPSSECCEALKTVMTTQLPCLCGLIRNPSALAGISMTQALALPKHCGLPSDTSACDVYVGPFEIETSVDKTKFTKVFVKNISESTTEEDLQKMFVEFGQLTSVVVIRNEDGTSKCFGFVNFEDADDAARAVDSLNGKKIDNKELYVGRAHKKSEETSRALAEMNGKMIGSKPLDVALAQRKEDRRALSLSLSSPAQAPGYSSPPAPDLETVDSSDYVPDFTPPSEGGSSISGGVAGIVIARVVVTNIFLFGVLWWKGCFRCKDSMHDDSKGLDLHTGAFTPEQIKAATNDDSKGLDLHAGTLTPAQIKATTNDDSKGLDLHTGTFTLEKIKAATNDFDPANKIGEGGFGPVFKGVLLEGTVIAVKQLSSKSKQGNREFITELGIISALQHPHLVKLYGCCIESNQLLLVYEYLENNNLARALFGPEEQQLKLDWPTRHKICIGIARGLTYLHEESRLKIVHRDIKASNVLLDKNLIPKISDFGLAKLHEEDNTHISTRVAGTFGYMAPEYAMRGYLSDKADVYSFGVVLLEVISGRSNTIMKTKNDCFYLLDWANTLKGRGNLIELVDSRLGSDFNREEAMTAINVALHCTNAVAAERPSMSAVVSILEGRSCIQHLASDTDVSVGKMSGEEAEGQSISMDAPPASPPTADLYPVTLDTKT